MIYTRISDGLGNQLFQWATALALAHKNGTEVRFDLRSFEHSQFSVDKAFPRTFKLNRFKISAQIAREEEMRPMFGRSTLNHWKPLVFAARLLLKKRLILQYVKEPSLDFHPYILELGDSVYLEGYWASEKYFINIANIVRQQAQVQDERIREYASDFCERHRRMGIPLVGVQVRRGDVFHACEVLKKPGVMPMPVTRRDYFIRAMAEFGPKTVFLMFSDSARDIERCRSEFADCQNIHFVTGNDDVTDFAILQKCDHQIISNSTFGWWAAWLNPNENKTVIYPKNWYVPGSPADHNMSDMIPSRWRPI